MPIIYARLERVGSWSPIPGTRRMVSHYVRNEPRYHRSARTEAMELIGESVWKLREERQVRGLTIIKHVDGRGESVAVIW